MEMCSYHATRLVRLGYERTYAYSFWGILMNLDVIQKRIMLHNKSIYAQIERVEVTCVVRKNRRPGHAWALALHSGGHSRTRDRDETKRSEFATEPNKG